MRQSGEIAAQQVDGEGQRRRGIDHGQHEYVVQQEALAEYVAQPGVAVAQHQEDGDDYVVDVDEKSRHEGDVQEIAALEPEPGQAVGRRQSHNYQYRQGESRDDDAVEHIAAHARLLPGIHEVLPVEARGERPGVLVEFRVLLDGGHEHPDHGDDDGDGHGDEHDVYEDLVQLIAL